MSRVGDELDERRKLDIDALDLPACCRGRLRTMLRMKEFEPALEAFLTSSPHVAVIGVPTRPASQRADERGRGLWNRAVRAVPLVYLANLLQMASRHVEAHPDNERVSSFWRELASALDEIVRSRLDLGSLEDIASVLEELE